MLVSFSSVEILNLAYIIQLLSFTYFWDMMHSRSLEVLNTLNISAHRDDPQLDVVTVNSERF